MVYIDTKIIYEQGHLYIRIAKQLGNLFLTLKKCTVKTCDT